MPAPTMAMSTVSSSYISSLWLFDAWRDSDDFAKCDLLAGEFVKLKLAAGGGTEILARPKLEIFRISEDFRIVGYIAPETHLNPSDHLA